MRGIHWSPVNSPHKGQWRGALMFSLICAWINGWVNNEEAGDFRRHHTHYDVTVMHLLVRTSNKMECCELIGHSRKSYNAPIPHPTMHHTRTEMRTSSIYLPHMLVFISFIQFPNENNQKCMSENFLKILMATWFCKTSTTKSNSDWLCLCYPIWSTRSKQSSAIWMECNKSPWQGPD